MNEFVDIIVIYIVLRAILAFLGAWWHGDGRNEFQTRPINGSVSIVLCTITQSSI